MKDMYDVKMYQRHRDFVANGNLTFTFNTVVSSSTYSIWPLYIQINEVKPGKRAHGIVLQGLVWKRKATHEYIS